MLGPACLVFELGFIFEFGYLAVWVLLGLVRFEFWVFLSFGGVVFCSCLVMYISLMWPPDFPYLKGVRVRPV